MTGQHAMGLDGLDLRFRLERRLGIKIAYTEALAAFQTVRTLHRYLVAKVHGELREIPNIEALFQEVSGAVNRITGWWRLTSSLDLNRRFAPAARAAHWHALEEALGVPLPDLEQRRDEEFPSIPVQCDNIVSLARWIAQNHPERAERLPVSCERTGKMATHQWTDDEVWEILYQSLSDVLGIKPDEITPDARLVEDLGMS